MTAAGWCLWIGAKTLPLFCLAADCQTERPGMLGLLGFVGCGADKASCQRVSEKVQPMRLWYVTSFSSIFDTFKCKSRVGSPLFNLAQQLSAHGSCVFLLHPPPHASGTLPLPLGRKQNIHHETISMLSREWFECRGKSYVGGIHAHVA